MIRRRLCPSWVALAFSTRKCRAGAACPDAGEFHTAHLTRFGEWLYT